MNPQTRCGDDVWCRIPHNLTFLSPEPTVRMFPVEESNVCEVGGYGLWGKSAASS